MLIELELEKIINYMKKIYGDDHAKRFVLNNKDRGISTHDDMIVLNIRSNFATKALQFHKTFNDAAIIYHGLYMMHNHVARTVHSRVIIDKNEKMLLVYMEFYHPNVSQYLREYHDIVINKTHKKINPFRNCSIILKSRMTPFIIDDVAVEFRFGDNCNVVRIDWYLFFVHKGMAGSTVWT